MNMQQFQREDDVTYRVVDHGDGVEHVVDLGADAMDATVDVVDDTVIVVTDDDQYDVALPDSDARVFMQNGVLTITTEEPA